MSRSAAKSRADKSRASAVPAPAPPPPSSTAAQPVADTVDVVPGRFTESAWVAMVMREEGEEEVAELLEELMGGVMDRCYQVYLQKQLVPFSAWLARDALLQTVEWCFLVRDEGEAADSAPLWQEDPEPQPIACDAWAEGSVPVVYAKVASHTPLLQKLLDLHLAESEDLWDPDTHSRTQSPSKVGLAKDKKMVQIEPEGPQTSTEPVVLVRATELLTEPKEIQPSSFASQAPMSKSKGGKRKKTLQSHPPQASLLAYKTHNSFHPSNASPCGPIKEEQDHQVSQDQNLRSKAPRRPRPPPAVRKLDPAQLPQNQVWPEVEVLEPQRPQRPQRKMRGLSEVQLKQNHRSMGRRATITRQRGPDNDHRRNVTPGALGLESHDDAQERGLGLGFTPHSTGLSLESMTLARGVALGNPMERPSSTSEGNPTRTGHRPDLRPIRTSPLAPLWSLDQTVTLQSPRVTPQSGPGWA